MSKKTLLVLFLIAFSTMIFDKHWRSGIIVWDIMSYYAYLPATFIEHDLSLKFTDRDSVKYHEHYQPGIAPNGARVIRTTMGLSVLYAPFFAIAHIYALSSGGYHLTDGYSQPYQIAIQFSALFYAMIGWWFLRKILLRYFSESATSMTLAAVFLGTNAWHYTTTEGAMSHIFNFAMFNVFLYLTILWHERPNWRNTLYLGLISGMIILVRPPNVIIALVFILYNIYPKSGLGDKLRLFWNEKSKLIAMIALAFLFFVPQMLYWHWLTGNWIYNCYIGERFYFDRPRFIPGLFSYTKGWFVYTPMMFLATLGFGVLWKKARPVFFSALVFQFVFAWIALSWWAWWYGGSFGLRAFVDTYGIMSLPLAALVQAGMEAKWIVKAGCSTLIVLLIALNQFQTWQYHKAIIHWDSMSQEAYWAVFLKTKTPEGYDKMLKPLRYEKAREGILEYW